MLHNKRNTKSGITLVALIITVIVLLVLATVSINLVINSGIINKTKSAVDKYSEEEISEQIKLAYSEWEMAKYLDNVGDVADYIKSSLNATYGNNAIEDVSKTGNTFMVTFSDGRIYTYNISKGKATDLTNTTNIAKSDKKTDSFVGCYADIDADGTVDGVIFADLLTGSIRDTQQWGDSNGKYSIPKLSADSLKDYYVSRESYKWANTEEAKPVLSPKGSGDDRFYIMRLSDFTTADYTRFCWYKNAVRQMSDYLTATSTEFETGKTNTDEIIKRWKKGKAENGGYGEQEDQDIWKHIQTKYADGWFIPSRAEWAAFANELEITGTSTGNYNSKYGLNAGYWTSSQSGTGYIWDATFSLGYMFSWIDVNNTRCVRLATTF